jgi:CHAT domain-containing protein
LNNLGNLHRDKQEFSEAEKAYEEALEKNKQAANWGVATISAYNLFTVKSDKRILESSRKLLELGILFSKEEKYKYVQKGTNEFIYRDLLENDINMFGVLEALRGPEELSLCWDHVLPQRELERSQEDVEFQKKVVEDMLKKPIPPIKVMKLPEDLLFTYIQKIGDSVFFFVINSDGIQKFKGEKRFFTTGVKLLLLLRFQLRVAGKPRLRIYVKKFEELTREWYGILPHELKELIQEKNEIIFSPDYYCSFFPLEALQMDRKPLCIEKTVVRAASLHQFLRILEKKPTFDTGLIIGNPWPECDGKELQYMLALGSERFEISFLQGAEEEARELVGNISNATLLLRHKATGEKFLSEISRHSLIHFSGHGSMGRILFLAGPSQGFPPPFEPEEFSDLRKAQRHDKTRKINMMEEWHPVTDLDLFDIKLKEGAVVFLNACETGQHKYAGGGYYQGLPAVFLKNGAHSVISSLVPIFDKHSKEFSLHFYENLLRTRSVAGSLKEARKQMRDAHKAQIYWIPYIHYGPPL